MIKTKRTIYKENAQKLFCYLTMGAFLFFFLFQLGA